MGATPKLDLAVIGSSSLIGENFIELLDERSFPLATLYPLELGEAASGRIGCAGKHWHVGDLETFDFSLVSLAVFCGAELPSEEWVQRAMTAGALVIDLSPTAGLQPGVPMLVPEFNPQALADLRETGIVASPSALAVALTLALEPFRELAGISRVDVATYQSLSHHGRSGVGLLSSQTVALLNCREVELGEYPAQVAFNLLPQVGELDADGFSSGERRLMMEIDKLFNGAIPPIGVTAVQVPTFYGDAMVIHLECEQAVPVDVVRDALSAAPGIKFMDESETAGYPTPVGDAVGSDTVFVGRLRQHPDYPERFSFWVTVDNLRKGSALNAIQIAEILVKDYI